MEGQGRLVNAGGKLTEYQEARMGRRFIVPVHGDKVSEDCQLAAQGWDHPPSSSLQLVTQLQSTPNWSNDCSFRGLHERGCPLMYMWKAILVYINKSPGTTMRRYEHCPVVVTSVYKRIERG
jgi:hypothetical protein